MAAQYVPIRTAQMNDLLCHDMGFAPVDIKGCGEFVYERDVITKSLVVHPYKIRVYSSIRKETGWSDTCGCDAIRVVLIDKVTNRPAKKSEKRVHRTKNALKNLRARCRDAFRYVLEAENCPRCKAMLVEREAKKTGSKFMGCSRYAPGRDHHCGFSRNVPA